MIYKFKPGAHLNGDAQVVGEELEQIRKQHGGLVPKVVVEHARPEENALHPHFEWDDAKAADLFREDQARHVIRSVQVSYDTPANEAPSKEIRAFVAVQRQDGERIYESTAVALSDDDYRKQVLARAWREMTQIRDKYSDLKELAEVFQAMEHVGEIMREPTAVA